MLEVHDLTLRYGQSEILHGVTLTALAGEVTAVMGVKGGGKTSLLKGISGGHPFRSGRILLDGVDIGRPTAQAAARAGIAYVPQGREIFPFLTVRENLETGYACLSRPERRVEDAIYALFPVLAQMRDRRGGDLSGGQQQQLAIARALVSRPRVLLLDEPTEGIQPNIIQQIGRVIEHLRAEGQMAIVLVEQYFDFAHRLADRIEVMNRGQVILTERKEALDREKLLATMSL